MYSTFFVHDYLVKSVEFNNIQTYENDICVDSLGASPLGDTFPGEFFWGISFRFRSIFGNLSRNQVSY